VLKSDKTLLVDWKSQGQKPTICSHKPDKHSTHLGPVGCLHSPELNNKKIDNMKQKSSCFGSKDIDFQQFRQMQMSQEVTRELPTGEICAEVQGCSHLFFCPLKLTWLDNTVLSTLRRWQRKALQGTSNKPKKTLPALNLWITLDSFGLLGM